MKISSETQMRLVNAYKKYLKGIESYRSELSDDEMGLFTLYIRNKHLKNVSQVSEKTGFPLCLCSDLALVGNANTKKSNLKRRTYKN